MRATSDRQAPVSPQRPVVDWARLNVNTDGYEGYDAIDTHPNGALVQAENGRHFGDAQNADKNAEDALLAYYPLLAIVIGAVTYAACRVIAAATPVYLGDIPFPFFSDTGRDPPAYYIFMTGLCACAICYLIAYRTIYGRCGLWEAQFEREDWPRRPQFERWRFWGLVFATCAAPCLCTLSALDTSSYPRMHQLAADCFSAFSTLATICYTRYFRILVEMFPEHRGLRLSMLAKTLVCLVWVAAFALYVPIGVLVCCPARLLSMEECRGYDYLPQGYCEGHVSRNDAHFTSLWTYKDCPNTFTMRTVAQFTCITCIILYAGTFSFDLTPKMRRLVPRCSQTGP